MLDRNYHSNAVQRKRPSDLLHFCKRFRLHVGKTPIDGAGYDALLYQYGKVKLSSYGAITVRRRAACERLLCLGTP